MSTPSDILKPHWIYIVNRKPFGSRSGGIYEMLYVGTVRDISIWRSLPFTQCDENTPRFIKLQEIEWAEPIIEIKGEEVVTEEDYTAALNRINERPT